MTTFPHFIGPLTPFDGVIVWPGALAVAVCFLAAVALTVAIETGRRWVAFYARAKKPSKRLVTRRQPQHHAA